MSTHIAEINERSGDYLLIDEDKLLEEHPRLLLYAAKWCNRCRLSPIEEADDILNEAVIALYETKNKKEVNQTAFLIKKIQQIACNRIRKRVGHAGYPADQVHLAAHGPGNHIDPELPIATRNIFSEIYSLADQKDDQDLCMLLMAYSSGLNKRKDIVEETGMNNEQYGAAKKRLDTLLRNLPEALLAEVAEIVGGENA